MRTFLGVLVGLALGALLTLAVLRGRGGAGGGGSILPPRNPLVGTWRGLRVDPGVHVGDPQQDYPGRSYKVTLEFLPDGTFLSSDESFGPSAKVGKYKMIPNRRLILNPDLGGGEHEDVLVPYELKGHHLKIEGLDLSQE
jgi:hypothetical protein